MSRKLVLYILVAVSIAGIWFISTGFGSVRSEWRVAPYLQFGTDSSMVVMWENHDETSGFVRFSESEMGADYPALDHVIHSDGTRMLHEVVLTGLEPNTKYFWSAVSVTADGDTLASEPSTFRTTVGESSAFAFVLYGDSQSNPDTWGRVAELGWLERPNFALLAGDLVGTGGNINHWLEEFFPPAKVLMERVPLYTALGNHEDDDENYYRYMHNPPPEYYYTFNYGNAQFFIVDTNRDVTEGSEQYNWLEEELAASTATWKFVMHHHPPYSSEENDHGDSWVGSTDYGTHARNLVPLFEAYGVDFSLFGHVHMYERTWPIFDGEINQHNGVIYINSGGAGGGLEQFAPTRSWFSAKLKSVHHYSYFSIQDNKLQFQAIDEWGNMFDTFELIKDEERIARAKVAKPSSPQYYPRATLFTDYVEVELTSRMEDVTIHYTTDGSEPTASSPRYVRPIRIEDTMALRSVTLTKDGNPSRLREEVYTKVVPTPAQVVPNAEDGLQTRYFEGNWSKLPDFDALEPVRETVEPVISLRPADREDEIGLVFEGYVEAPESGVYTFFLTSDDGSKLFINGEQVINNDGLHGTNEEAGQVALEEGLHAFKVTFFERSSGEALSIQWAGPGLEKQHIRAGSFYHSR